MIEYLLELKGVKSSTVNFATHMYSHLMKCTYHTSIAPSWLGTINNCHKELVKIKNNEKNNFNLINSNYLQKIKDNAIEEYKKEDNRNKEAERTLTIVQSTFENLHDLTDNNKLKTYLMNRAKEINDYVAIEKISKEF